MTLYIGVDFHPHTQTLCWIDGKTGETGKKKLGNVIEQVRELYAGFGEPAVVGVEATGRAEWFEDILEELGHNLVIGNPALIRKRATSRHKSDDRDALNIVTLLAGDEFPEIWRRPRTSDHVLDLLRLRQSFVRQRTQIYNRLQALAHRVGMPKSHMRTVACREMLKAVEMSRSGEIMRESLFEQLGSLERVIGRLDKVLEETGANDDRVMLLRTQSGVGLLTALTVVHTIGDVTRFPRLAKQISAYAGLDPLEASSGARTRFGSISKCGASLLRYQLGLAAQIAARHDARLKAFYKRLARKKPKAVAKTAAARKLLIKLAIMLRDNIDAAEFDERGRTVGNARETQGLK